MLSGEVSGGTESFTEQVVLGYNRQGQVTWRGESAYGPPASVSYRARHTLYYDDVGRLEKDAVSTNPPPASDVDTSVMRLRFEYDSHDRWVRAESLDGSDAQVNVVVRRFGKDGFVTESGQAHKPRGGQTWSESVGYTYASGPGSSKRLSNVSYPEVGGTRRTVSYTYEQGASEWQKADWMLGRVTRLDSTLSGATDRVAYTYMGSERAMRVVYGSSPTTATLEFRGAQGSALGLDRFGRPKRLYAQASASQVFEYAYSYDRLHNVTLKDGSGAFPQPFHDEAFAYDDVSRLGRWTPEGTWGMTGSAGT